MAGSMATCHIHKSKFPEHRCVSVARGIGPATASFKLDILAMSGCGVSSHRHRTNTPPQQPQRFQRFYGTYSVFRGKNGRFGTEWQYIRGSVLSYIQLYAVETLMMCRGYLSVAVTVGAHRCVFEPGITRHTLSMSLSVRTCEPDRETARSWTVFELATPVSHYHAWLGPLDHTSTTSRRRAREWGANEP